MKKYLLAFLLLTAGCTKVENIIEPVTTEAEFTGRWHSVKYDIDVYIYQHSETTGDAFIYLGDLYAGAGTCGIDENKNKISFSIASSSYYEQYVFGFTGKLTQDTLIANCAGYLMANGLVIKFGNNSENISFRRYHE